jgi:exosortase
MTPVSALPTTERQPQPSGVPTLGSAASRLGRARPHWLPLAASLALLWFILLNQLRGAWAADPQYSYGFIVPLLAVGLLLRRWGHERLRTEDGPRDYKTTRPQDYGLGTRLVFVGCALLILPLRLILEANPDWRMLNWVLAAETVILTLILLYRVGGWNWVGWFAFPVAFILVAVPWPFTIERPVIQGLTRFNVAFVIEALGWVGVPAAQHGNVIEIGAGAVGVEEACSGIRSFQSSLMISLFFGEFYLMSRQRRLLLVPLGFLSAIAFNACRTSFLTFIAAKKGVPAIAQYHDQAGLTILLACTATLWLLSWLLSKMPNAKCSMPNFEFSIFNFQPSRTNNASPPNTGKTKPPTRTTPPANLQLSTFNLQPSTFLLIWLIFVETSVESWYRLHEGPAASVPAWTVPWPPPYPGFTDLPISATVREILDYDEGHSGRWQTADGAAWGINYFRWRPGKQQAWLAGIHRPDICMASLGHALRQQEKRTIRVGWLDLPFQVYTYEEAGKFFRVYHCFWEQRSAGKDSSPVEPGRSQRLRAVLKGQRNLGQQSLQFSVHGLEDETEATRALQGQLQNALRVEPGGKGNYGSL